MIAEDDDCAVRRVPFDQVEHRYRIRAVADEVAEKRVAVRPQGLRMREAGGDRFEIAVDIGEQSELHRDLVSDAGPVSSMREMYHPLARTQRPGAAPTEGALEPRWRCGRVFGDLETCNRSPRLIIALLSDVHGNLEALNACLKHAGEHGVGRYAFLGDLVGYGAIRKRSSTSSRATRRPGRSP